MTPTVLICCDKFKGSASSRAVASALGRGLESTGCRVLIRPLADGGDGTLEVFDDLGFRRRTARVRDSGGRPVDAEYALGTDTTESSAPAVPTAVIEVARACGLDMVSPGGATPSAQDARAAGSWGVGELVRAALDDGARRIILGLGGSATTDAGFGMARALGVEFPGVNCSSVDSVADLGDVRAVDLSHLDPRLAQVEVVIASDVRNPLCGPDGAAAVYGPQKGIAAGDVADVDAALAHFATVVEDALGTSYVAGRPGAGAAGGLGFMAMALAGAQMRSGVELILEETGFADALGRADLVVTGEGRIDSQTLSGKAPAGVAERARGHRDHRVHGEHGVPVIAVCGENRLAASDDGGLFTAIHALTDHEPDVAECMRNPLPILERIGAEIGCTYVSSGP